MIKKIIPLILILPAIILVIYVISYLFLREYKYSDTKNSTFASIGVNSFYYFDRNYVNAYPMTNYDAKVVVLFMTSYKMKPLIFFFPLERLELFFRGKPVVKLTKQEEFDILKEE